MMQFVSKERYINSITNGEKSFLIYVDNDSNVWLQADMEIGGEFRTIPSRVNGF